MLGFLLLVLYPVRLSFPCSSSAPPPSFVTHSFVTHKVSHTHTQPSYLSHATLPHAASSHTSCHHNFVIHVQSFAQFGHAQLCQPQPFHTQTCHAQLLHTQLFHTLLHTQLVTHSLVMLTCFCVAGVGLMALAGSGARLVAVGPFGRRSLCVASMALGDIDLRFTWQACACDIHAALG